MTNYLKYRAILVSAECPLECECKGVSAAGPRGGTADLIVRPERFDWQRHSRFQIVSDFLLLFCERALCNGFRTLVDGTPLSSCGIWLVSTSRRLQLPIPSNWFRWINLFLCVVNLLTANYDVILPIGETVDYLKITSSHRSHASKVVRVKGYRSASFYHRYEFVKVNRDQLIFK